MFSSTESLQWFDPALILPGGPLAFSSHTDGNTGAEETSDLAMQRLLVQHELYDELANTTLSSSPANSTHVHSILAKLKQQPTQPASRRRGADGGGGGDPLRYFGLSSAAQGMLGADGEGESGRQERRGSTGSHGHEPTLQLFHNEDLFNRGGDGNAGDTKSPSSQHATTSTQHFFRDVPSTLGVEVGAVLCPLLLDNAADSRTDAARAPQKVHMASSHEIFAITTRTVPQRLLVFDQLNDIPISDIALAGEPMLPTGGGSGGRRTSSSPRQALHLQQQSNAAAAQASGLPMSVSVVPCSIDEHDAVRAVIFDASGHFLVVTFASGKAAYLFIPRRNTTAVPPPDREEDAEGNPDRGGEDDDGNGTGAAAGEDAAARRRRRERQEQRHEAERQRRHKEWKAAARRWATLGLQKKPKRPSVEAEGDGGDGTSSTRRRRSGDEGDANADGDDEDDEAYQPTLFSLTFFCEEKRSTRNAAGAAVTGGLPKSATPTTTTPFLVESVAWRTDGIATSWGGGVHSTRSAGSGAPIGTHCSAELLLGSRHGGLIVCCALSNTCGAMRARVVYAFPSPFSRRPIHSIVCYVAPPALTDDGRGQSGAGRATRRGSRGEPSAGAGTGQDDVSTAPGHSAAFDHASHFLSVDEYDDDSPSRRRHARGATAASVPTSASVDPRIGPHTPAHAQRASALGERPSRCFVLLSMQNSLFVFATSGHPSRAAVDGAGRATVESAFEAFPNRWSPRAAAAARHQVGRTHSFRAAGDALNAAPLPRAGWDSNRRDSGRLPHDHHPAHAPRHEAAPPQELDNFIALDSRVLQMTAGAPAHLKGKLYLVLPEEMQHPDDVDDCAVAVRQGGGSATRNPLAWNAPDGITTELPPVFYWQYGSACLVQGLLLHGSLNVLEKARAMVRQQQVATDPWVSRLLATTFARLYESDAAPAEGAAGRTLTHDDGVAGEPDERGPFDLTLLPIGVLSVTHLPDRLRSLGQLILSANKTEVGDDARAWGGGSVTAPIMFKRARASPRQPHHRHHSAHHKRGHAVRSSSPPRMQPREPASVASAAPRGLSTRVVALMDPAVARGEVTRETLEMLLVLKRQYRATRRRSWQMAQWSVGTGVGGGHATRAARRDDEVASAETGAHRHHRTGCASRYSVSPTEERLVSFSVSYNHIAMTTTKALYLFSHLAAAPLPGSRQRGLSGALGWKNMLLYTAPFAPPGAAAPATVPSPASVPRVCRDRFFPSFFYLVSGGSGSGDGRGGAAFTGEEDILRFEMTRTHTQQGFAVAQLLALADRLRDERAPPRRRIEPGTAAAVETESRARLAYDIRVRRRGASAAAAAAFSSSQEGGGGVREGSLASDGPLSRQTSEARHPPRHPFAHGAMGPRSNKTPGVMGSSLSSVGGPLTRAAALHVEPSSSVFGGPAASGPSQRGRPWRPARAVDGFSSPSSSSSDLSAMSSSAASSVSSRRTASSFSHASASDSEGASGDEGRRRDRLHGSRRGVHGGNSSVASLSSQGNRSGVAGGGAAVSGSRWHAMSSTGAPRSDATAFAGPLSHGPLGNRSITTAGRALANNSFAAGSFVAAPPGRRPASHSPRPQPQPSALSNQSVFAASPNLRSSVAFAGADARLAASFAFSAVVPDTQPQPLLGQWQEAGPDPGRRAWWRHPASADDEERERMNGALGSIGLGLGFAVMTGCDDGGIVEEPARTPLGFREVRTSAQEDRLHRFLRANPVLLDLLDHAAVPWSGTAASVAGGAGVGGDDVCSVQALVIPNMGVVPGWIDTSFCPSATAASSAAQGLYYQCDHLYEMALRLSASTLKGSYCASRALLDRTRHAYGSYLLAEGRHLEAAVQLGNISTAFFANGLTSFNTLLVEFSRVVRPGADLEPLIVLLRLRLRACEEAEGVGGGGGAAGLFMDCSVEKTVLATLLLSVLLERCNELQTLKQSSLPPPDSGSSAPSWSFPGTSTGNDRNGGGGNGQRRPSHDRPPRWRHAEPSRKTEEEGKRGSTAAPWTRRAFIRRKYHLERPSLLLEDVLLRYRGLLSREALSRILEGVASASGSAVVQELLQRGSGEGESAPDEEGDGDGAAAQEGDHRGRAEEAARTREERRVARETKESEGVCTTLLVRSQKYWEGLQRLREYRTPAAVPAFFDLFHGEDVDADSATRDSDTGEEEEEEEAARPPARGSPVPNSRPRDRAGKRVSFATDALRRQSVGGGQRGTAATPAKPYRPATQCTAPLSQAEQALRRKPFTIYAIQRTNVLPLPRRRPSLTAEGGSTAMNSSRDGDSHLERSLLTGTTIATTTTMAMGTTEGDAASTLSQLLPQRQRSRAPEPLPGVVYVAKPAVQLSPAAQARLWERFTPLLLRHIPRTLLHEGLLPQMAYETRRHGAVWIRPRQLLPSMLLYKRSWNTWESEQIAAAAGNAARRPSPQSTAAQRYAQAFTRQRHLSGQRRASSSGADAGGDDDADSSLLLTDGGGEKDDSEPAVARLSGGSAVTLRSDPDADALLADDSSDASSSSRSSRGTSSSSLELLSLSDAALAPSTEVVSITFFRSLVSDGDSAASGEGSPSSSIATDMSDPAVAVSLSTLLVKHAPDALLRSYMERLAAAEVREAARLYAEQQSVPRPTQLSSRRLSRSSAAPFCSSLHGVQQPSSLRDPTPTSSLPGIRALGAFIHRVSFDRGRLLGCAWAHHVLGHHLSAQHIALHSLHCPELAVHFLQRQRQRFDTLQESARGAAVANGGEGGTHREGPPPSHMHEGSPLVAEKELAKRRKLWLALAQFLLSSNNQRRGSQTSEGSTRDAPQRGDTAEKTTPSIVADDANARQARWQRHVADVCGSDVVLDGRGGPGTALQLIPLSSGDVDITDILPLLAPTTAIGRLQGSLLDALDAVSCSIAELQGSIEKGGQETALLQRDLLQRKWSHVVLLPNALSLSASDSRQQQHREQQTRCALCRQPALSRPFVAFPRCRHTMHLSCYHSRRAALLSAGGAGEEQGHRGQRRHAAGAAPGASGHSPTNGSTRGRGGRGGGGDGGVDDHSMVRLETFRMDSSGGAKNEDRSRGASLSTAAPPPVPRRGSMEGPESLACLLCAPAFVRLILRAPLSLQLVSTAAAAAGTEGQQQQQRRGARAGTVRLL